MKYYYVVEYGGMWMSKNQMIGMAAKEVHLSLGGLENYLSLHEEDTMKGKEEDLRALLSQIVHDPNKKGE